MENTKLAPTVALAAALNPALISTICSPKHIQSVIEDCQTAILSLGAALNAVLAEVSPGSTPFSADSYLPAHLVEIMRSALGYAKTDDLPWEISASYPDQAALANWTKEIEEMRRLTQAGGPFAPPLSASFLKFCPANRSDQTQAPASAPHQANDEAPSPHP